MATTKITVTQPDRQLLQIRALVAAGQSGSVSAFVKHAIDIALFDAAGWQEMLSGALRQTGGPLTNKALLGRFHPFPCPAQTALPEAESRVTGITLDAGALIALDRNDRRVLVLIARAMEGGMRVTVPATALAQAIRNPAKQARLSRLIRQPFTDVAPLDARHATAVGLLLAKSGTCDIAGAHVVVCARNAHQPVLTSDPGDLARLAPDLRLVAL